MKILKKIPVPTGFIVVVEGAKGMLEFLSIGDYGKPVNLNPDAPVPDNPPLLALTDKWVTTISTQSCGHAVLAHKKEPRKREGELVFIGGNPIGPTPFKPWTNKADSFEVEHK